MSCAGKAGTGTTCLRQNDTGPRFSSFGRVYINRDEYFGERYLSDGYEVPHSSSGTVDLSLFAKLSECWMRAMHYDCRMIHVGEDDVMNEDDLAVLIEQWLCRAPVNWDRADLDGDGVVGVSDFAEFCSHWLE